MAPQLTDLLMAGTRLHVADPRPRVTRELAPHAGARSLAGRVRRWLSCGGLATGGRYEPCTAC